VIRAIRDYFQPDIGEILIDTEEIYEQAKAFMQTVMPGNVGKVKLYRDDVPLFSRFQIEHQIESAYSRQVALPSGGAIVIDHTEALVAIDVNSARATRGGDIEETAFRTNLEAAEEVARQLRLRDLGGLIVIDFIDMESQRNQREVENRLRDALKYDRARVQIGKISRFGLMELSRQRLQASLEETAHISCPRCSGTGFIRGTESTALHVLRIIQEEAMKENTGAVHAQVPVDVSSFLLNEKRAEIQKLEARLKVNIVLVPNPHLETPHYKVQRLKHDELNQMEHVPASYELVEQPEEPKAPGAEEETKRERQEAAVKAITPAQPAPVVDQSLPRPQPVAEPPTALQPAAEGGFLSKLFGLFKPVTPATQPRVATPPATQPALQQQPRRDQQPRREHQQRRDRGEHRGDRDRGRDRGREGRARDEQRDRQQHGRLEQRRNGQPQQQRQQRPPQQQQQQRPQQQPQQQPREGDSERRGGRRNRRDRQRERREERPAAAPSLTMKEDQLREDQRREALARNDEPRAENALPSAPPAQAAPRVAEAAQRVEEPAPRIETPTIDPKALLESDGLVMIETDRSKAPVAPVEEAPPQLGRPRRERPKPAAQEDELQQVETRK
jgi:ribonuclease E